MWFYQGQELFIISVAGELLHYTATTLAANQGLLSWEVLMACLKMQINNVTVLCFGQQSL